MIGDDTLTKILDRFHREWGYAAGMEKILGFIPGAKSFPPYKVQVPEGKVSIVDTYFGKRESGGMAVASLNDVPFLLIQYHGGETPKVPDEAVREISDFLKRAIVCSPLARLPNMLGPHIFYEEDRYGYAGYAIGNIWDLTWAEIIYSKGGERDLRFLYEGPTAEERFIHTMAYGLRDAGQDLAIFYHVLTHQRIR